MFLAFYLGRAIDLSLFFPGFLAMALFFTASSVGPLITPWEKQAGTYERLLSFPVTVNTIILGDMLAGAVFGLVISCVVLIAGLIFLHLTISSLIGLILAMFLGTLCFASFGVLLAAPSSRAPSNVMMLSSLVRFPLIFVSGIFVPLDRLHGAGRVLSYVSPLTYLVDMLNAGFRGNAVMPFVINGLTLIAFTTLFLLIATFFHRRNIVKGL